MKSVYFDGEKLTKTLRSSQDDAEHMLALRGEVDVIGVQDWDGKGNVHIYINAFLFATAQSKIFYAYTDTPTEKEMWTRAIHMGVAHAMAADGSHAATHMPEPLASPVNSSLSSTNEVDLQTDCPLCPAESALLARSRCLSCDNFFCEKHAINDIPLPQCQYYYAKRVCTECYYTQQFLNYLKAIVDRLKAGICLYPKRLDIENRIELITPCRPSHTEATNIALELFKEGAITAEELEQLLLADRRYQDNTAEDPEIPLDMKILAMHRKFRSQDFGVLEAIIMLHQHLDENSMLFKPIVQKLLQFSYSHINEVEFYWPQIVHAYLRLPMLAFDKLFWMDELIMSITSRSIHLALLLMWYLQGALEDSLLPNTPKDLEDRYPRIIRLMIMLEVHVVGRDRYELLQNTANRVRPGIPKATEEQIHLIVENMNMILKYKENAPISDSEREKKEMKESRIIVQDSLVLGTGEEVRFSDFSTFQKHLLTPTSAAESMFGQRDSDESVEEQRISGRARTLSHAEKSVLSAYFEDERNFVDDITDIAEKLRFVYPPNERKKDLPGHLEKLAVPDMVYVPLVKATDSFERILRIPPNEATAFSTKARVPIMLIFEVVRGGPGGLNRPESPTRASSSRGHSFEADDEIGRLLKVQSSRMLMPSASEKVECNDEDEEEKEETKPALEIPIDSFVEGELPPAPATPVGVVCQSTPVNKDETISLESSTPDAIIVDVPSIDLSEIQLSQEAIQRENERKGELEAAFGESWDSKRQRLQQISPFGHLPGWDIVSMIGKSNDDLRQEVFALQLIQKFKDIFKRAKLPMWLKCYRIIATSSSTGLIETLINAISLDGLKKREGYVSLANHFEKSYGPVDSPRFLEARQNLIQSMAAYSLVTYFLQIKDRHNGNIMLSSEGHIIHIDFGFLLGIAPGGSFSIETAPFKLTAEMVEAMGGVGSESFQEFASLCTHGFIACQQNCDELCDFVEMMAHQSPYPCFSGKDTSYINQRFRSRFKVGLSKTETANHMMYLIRKSNSNYSTRQYDNFQRMTNGILP